MLASDLGILFIWNFVNFGILRVNSIVELSIWVYLDVFWCILVDFVDCPAGLSLAIMTH